MFVTLSVHKAIWSKKNRWCVINANGCVLWKYCNMLEGGDGSNKRALRTNANSVSWGRKTILLTFFFSRQTKRLKNPLLLRFVYKQDHNQSLKFNTMRLLPSILLRQRYLLMDEVGRLRTPNIIHNFALSPYKSPLFIIRPSYNNKIIIIYQQPQINPNINPTSNQH